MTEIAGEGIEHDALVRAVRDAAGKLIELTDAPKGAVQVVEGLDNAGVLADRVAANAGAPPGGARRDPERARHHAAPGPAAVRARTPARRAHGAGQGQR